MAADGIKVTRVYKKEASKTWKIENFNFLKATPLCCQTEFLDDIYTLCVEKKHWCEIESTHPGFDYIYSFKVYRKDTLSIVKVHINLSVSDNDGGEIFITGGSMSSSWLNLTASSNGYEQPDGSITFYWRMTSVICTDRIEEDITFSHVEDLSRDFGDLLAKQTFADVQLEMGEVSIPAHSLILSTRSKVFATMFHYDTLEKRSGTIQIPDVEAPIMSHLLTYIYTGKLEKMRDLSSEELVGLYTAADKYEVLRLKDMCSKFIPPSLSEENIILFAELACKHNDDHIMKAVVDFISTNNSILETEPWHQLATSMPSLSAVMLTAFLEKVQHHAKDMSTCSTTLTL